MSPSSSTDYHISETTEIFIQKSSSDSRPSNLHESEISECTIGRALSSPLCTQERGEPASRTQAYHSPEESLLSCQSLYVGHVRTEKFHTCEGRVVLRADFTKYDSGNYAVFTEQGASASHMTSGKVLDVVSRPPGCSGQASDAVNAYTQVKMKSAPERLHPFGRRLSKDLDHMTECKKTTNLGLN